MRNIIEMKYPDSGLSHRLLFWTRIIARVRFPPSKDHNILIENPGPDCNTTSAEIMSARYYREICKRLIQEKPS